MKRANLILQNQLFRAHLEQNRVAEADRCFCHHDMGHFLDVARIARIICLQEGIEIGEDILYAAALLHDIGRHIQYEDGTPHETASARIAPQILAQCDYSEWESNYIVDAIRAHRDASVETEQNLRGVLYRADKASRACFACAAEKECNWERKKKNLLIRY